MVFQDPYSSLNPRPTVDGHPHRAAGGARRPATTEAGARVARAARPGRAAGRRRAPASRASSPAVSASGSRSPARSRCEPRLIVCDEPVSALDLSTQARVLDLFIEIQQDTGVAYLFVSHDLGVVRHVSHRVAVMYRGEIVEVGDGDQVTSRPEHPYTRTLLGAAPVADPERQRRRREQREAVMARDARPGGGGT